MYFKKQNNAKPIYFNNKIQQSIYYKGIKLLILFFLDGNV